MSSMMGGLWTGREAPLGSLRAHVGQDIPDFVCISCGTEELDDSMLPADNQPDAPELSSLAAMDLTSALTLSDTVPEPGVSAAEPARLLAESTDLPAPLSEPKDSSPINASSLLVEPTEPSVCIEDPPGTSSPVDLLQASAESESMADTSPTQVVEETGPAEESAEPLDEAPAHHCGHEGDVEEPEE